MAARRARAAAASRLAAGMRERSVPPLMPCVPVLAPRGAASWHGSPFLHVSRGLHHQALVQMSVGFMRVSPVWQYVMVWRVNRCMKESLRSLARGFSMNHHVGFRFSMMSSVFHTSATPSRALSVFGE